MSKRPNEILRSGLGCVARIGAVGLIGLLASCMTPPVESPPVNPDIFQALPQDPLSPTPAPRPVSFDDLPGWDGADLMAPLQAFRRSCRRVMARDDTRAYSDRVGYAGSVGDWRSACAALSVANDSESARRVFEALFTPLEVISGEGTPRFTGYFEPEIEARREPVFPFTHPVPGVPNDLERVNGAQLGLSPRETFAAQRLPDGTLRRYPARAEIALRQENALGYAHPADVFFLQIQGSGRLNFEDGQSMRAA
ncbi:MAG: MltA domain-containing protein, partial [Pseudomonadota bacterium]